MDHTLEIPVLWYVAAAVGYEESSPICAATAEALRARLADIDEDLPAALGFTAVEQSGDGRLDLTSWLKTQCAADARQKRWNATADRLRPYAPTRADGVREPQCILLLSARHLTDASCRTALVSALDSVRDSFCGFLLALFDERGSELRPLTDLDGAAEWAREFSSLLPAQVGVYVLSTTTQTGRPIEPRELGLLAAAILAADLVVPEPSAQRILTPRPSDASSTVATLGGRAIELDHGLLADRLAPRLVSDLLKQSVLLDAPPFPESHGVPARTVDILRHMISGGAADGVSLRVTGRPEGEGSLRQPALVGAGFRATVDFGGLGKQLHLDRVPRRDWLAQLHEWDVLLRKGNAPKLLDRATQELSRLKPEQAARICEHLVDALARKGGDSLAPLACEAVRGRIDAEYALRTTDEGTPTLAHDLKAVRQTLGGIPHGPGLFLRTGMLVTVSLLLLALIWQHSASLLRSVLVVALPALAAIAACWAIAFRLRSLAVAQRARDAAVENTERRCQLKYVHALVTLFKTLHSDLSGRLDQWARQIDEIRAALRAIAASVAAPRDIPQGGLVQALPNRGDDDRIYAWLFGTDFAEGRTSDMVPRFLSELRNAAHRVLSGEAEPSTVADTVRTFAQTELLRLTRSRLRLWHLLRPELGGPPIRPDPETARRCLSDLLSGDATVCLPGRAVEHALLDPHASQSAFIAPRVLLPACADSRFEAIESGVTDALVVAWRVTLAQSRGAQHACQAGPAGQQESP